MGLFDWIGEAIGGAFSALAEFIGDAFKAVARPIVGQIMDSTADAIPKMNAEAAVGTIDEKMFRTKEFQEIAVELKKRLEHSPGGVADWFQSTLGGVFTGFYDVLITTIVPTKIDDFEDAYSGAGYLTFLCIDLAVLIGVLDVIATALSATLIRNLVHIGRLFMGTFGMDRYVGAVIAPALNAGLIPHLNQGFNEHYQAKIPGSTDLVRMELREVFHPDFREELLSPATSEKFKETMRKQGFDDYWSDSFWGAHWVLPSLGDLDKMLHRRHIDIDAWRTMVRRNDYLPAWIDMREKIIYKPYTRVDVRRMWDLAQLSEQEVYENYLDLGYDDDHAKKMTIWTKIYVLAVEIRARYSKGWISAEDVKSEIIAAGMPPARAETWVQKIVKADQEERMTPEKDLVKSEIIKGVKKGFISVSEGVELLVDMGYDEAEAEYIIAINVEAIGGSPETLEEFQDIVNKRRIAMGLPIRKKEPKTKKTGTGSDKILEAPTSKNKKK